MPLRRSVNPWFNQSQFKREGGAIAGDWDAFAARGIVPLCLDGVCAEAFGRWPSGCHLAEEMLSFESVPLALTCARVFV